MAVDSTAALDQGGLVACGYEDVRIGDTVVASEFQIYQCGASTPVLEFDALRTARLRRTGSALQIIEIERWPFGAAWEWIDVPVHEWRLTAEDPASSRRRTLRLKPAVRPSEIANFLRVYGDWLATSARDRSCGSAEEFVARLFTATVSGDPDAEKLFRRMRDDAGLDGAAAEIHSMAVQTYTGWRETRVRASKD
jgi:hypothetical protein